MLRSLLFMSAALIMVGCDGVKETTAPQSDITAPADSAAVENAQAAYDAAIGLLSRQYFESLPEIATYYGAPPDLAPGAGAKLTDRSAAAEAQRRELLESIISDLKSIDVGALDANRARIIRTLIALFDGAAAPARAADYGGVLSSYGVWYLPYVINQNSGPTVDIPNMLEAQHTVSNADDAETYLSRLVELPGVLDGALEKLKSDVAIGASPPDFIVTKAKAVVDQFMAGEADANILYASFVKKLEDAGLDVEAYADRALPLVRDGVLPAYGRISDYLGEIAAAAPHDAGVWRLPNGDAFYRAMIRHMTDTDLDPDEVHRIGLAEVDRITAEMDAILRSVGMTDGTVGARMAALGADARFVAPNTQEGKAKILADIAAQLDGVNAVIGDWFGVLPEYGVEVRAVPAFSQDSAPGGYYDAPALDGSRPGIYWINLRDTAIWPSFTVPTLTYHEAVPGHHMQVAIALQQDAPLISNVLFSNPSGEGWALYAEALAAEMGLYAGDPYGDLGRLQDELHRAIRLVVDTGMHAKKWSREEAIDYMVETEGVELSEAVSEIERYAVWPGQALGYKIGMLKIQALRSDAEAAFGDEFDIREFHDRILAISSSALPIIEAEMQGWIAGAD